MVAAYAIALQVLFSGFIFSQHFAASASHSPVICLAVDTDNGDTPDNSPRHQTSFHHCVLCGASGWANTPLASAQIDYAPTAHRADFLVPTALWIDASRPVKTHKSQGPPTIA